MLLLRILKSSLHLYIHQKQPHAQSEGRGEARLVVGSMRKPLDGLMFHMHHSLPYRGRSEKAV